MKTKSIPFVAACCLLLGGCIYDTVPVEKAPLEGLMDQGVMPLDQGERLIDAAGLSADQGMVVDAAVLKPDQSVVVDVGVEMGVEEVDEGMVEPPGLPSSDWCDRVLRGGGVETSYAVGLARAHALVRFFGPFEDYVQPDKALADAVERWGDVTSAPDLGLYAGASTDVCHISKGKARDIPKTVVTVEEGVAFVQPGEGNVIIPEGVEQVVLDLRQMSGLPLQDQILVNLLPLLLDKQMTPLTMKTRERRGLYNDVRDVPMNQRAYTTRLVTTNGWRVSPRAKVSYRLAVWTGERLTPLAALLVANLRVENQALLLGEDVHLSVAESTWVPIKDEGVVVRTSELWKTDGERLPDVIPSDRRVFGRDEVLQALRELDLNTRVDLGAESGRTSWPEFDAKRVEVSSDLNEGVARAALLVAYGILDLFYVYLDETGRGLDAALPELLSQVAPAKVEERHHTHELLLRLLHHTKEAHSRVYDQAVDVTSWNADKAFYPFRVEHVLGEAYIDWSDMPQLRVGDKIVSIDGAPVAELYLKSEPLIAAATPTNKLAQLGITLARQSADGTTFELEDPSGIRRMEVLSPVPWKAEYSARLVGPRFLRQSGWLEDLGHADVYYVNLDRAFTQDASVVLRDARALSTAEYVVLDMRGYPSPSSFGALLSLLGTVVGKPYPSPSFWTPLYTGGTYRVKSPTQSQYPGPLAGTQFMGRVAHLVGPLTQSFAENLSMGLVTQQAATVVGQQTSGTNGNITDAVLPGKFGIRFTGLHVKYSDNATFYAVGIVPDIKALRSVEDIVSQRDSVLLSAVDALKSGR